MANSMKEILNKVDIDGNDNTNLFDNQDVNKIIKTTNDSLDNFDSLDDDFLSLKIKIFGIGGAGCNIVDYMIDHRIWPKDVKIYALNTDKRAMELIKRDNLDRYLLGKSVLRGNGSGGDPNMGQISVTDEDKQKIKSVLVGTDILFLVTGLGKGTGSGATPEIAKIAKELDILTIAIVGFPSMQSQGQKPYQNAVDSFNNLKNEVTSITRISNDKIINNTQDIQLSLFDAYKKVDEEISSIVHHIVSMVTNPSKINLDFQDIKNFFKKHKIFLANSFTLKNEYSKDELRNIVLNNLKTSTSDINIETKNADLIFDLNINSKVPPIIQSDIKEIFNEITKDHNLTVTFGINYVNDEQVTGSYIISGNEDFIESKSLDFDLKKEKTDNNEIFGFNFFPEDFEVKKTEPVNNTSEIKTGGISYETDEIPYEEDSGKIDSKEARKVITKALNEVLNVTSSVEVSKKPS